MHYAQALRVARSLMWLCIVLAVLYGIVIAALAGNGELTHHAAHRGSDQVPLPALFAIAGFVSSIMATLFAVGIAEENDGHLALAWTKPVSRMRFAMAYFAVDVLGIAAAFLIMFGSSSIFVVALASPDVIRIDPDTPLQLVRFLAMPLAYYGLVAAATASLARSCRGVSGGVWVGSLVVGALAAVGFPRPWGQMIAALDAINPLHYSTYQAVVGADTPHPSHVDVLGTGAILSPTLATDILALSLLLAAGVAARLLQWHRLEA